jgi:hypothetical protein
VKAIKSAFTFFTKLDLISRSERRESFLLESLRAVFEIDLFPPIGIKTSRFQQLPEGEMTLAAAFLATYFEEELRKWMSN